MTSPPYSFYYLSFDAFSSTVWISCQPLRSPSQCFFGAQMTELDSTFKDNYLIGVFSYAVASPGPEKGSDNSVITLLQQIDAFVPELWRMSWQIYTLSCPPSLYRLWDTAKIAGPLIIQIHVSVLSGLMTVSRCVKETSEFVRLRRGCRCVWEKSFLLLHCHCLLFERWKSTITRYIFFLLRYKVSDEVYLCKLFWRENITDMAAAFTQAPSFFFFFPPKALLSI